MGRALLPFSAFDNFSRRSSSGWGTATSGQGWSTSSLSNFTCNLADGVGIISSNTSKDTKPRVITLQTDTKTSTQSLLFSFNPVSWGSWADFGPVLLHNGADEYVALRIQPGLNTVSLWRRKQGDKSIESLSPDRNTNKNPQSEFEWRYVYKFTKNQWYWCRIEYDDTSRQIVYRIWKDVEEEPSSWDSKFSFGTNSERMNWRTGTPGFMAFGTNTFTAHIRSVYFYAGSSPTYTSDGWAPNVINSGTLPFSDSFDRTERQGFGKSQTGPLWYGTVIDNPNVLAPRGIGVVDNGQATLTFDKAYSTNGGYWAFVGDTVKDNRATEITAQFQTTALSDTVTLRLGPRGREGTYNDKVSGAAFAVSIPLKPESTISLVRRSSLNSTFWEPFGASSGDVVTQNFTLIENTAYSVRMYIKPLTEGYEIRAKLWKSSETEPSSFNLVYSNTVDPAIKQGAPFINVSTTGAGSVDILEFSASLVTTDPVVVTPPSNVFTVTAGLSKKTTTTTADVQFLYDGTTTSATQAFIEYFATDRPAEKFAISTLTGDVATPQNGIFKPTSGSLTGLRPETTYQITGRLEQAGRPASSVTFSLTTGYDGIWISDARIDSVTTNGFSAALILRNDLTETSLSNTTAHIKYREISLVTSYPWSNEIPMNKVTTKGTNNYAGYGSPNFWYTYSGLDPDKNYEVSLRIVDSNGIDGDVSVTEEIISKLVTTHGRKAAMEWIDPSTGVKQASPIVVTPEVTSAKVRIYYRWDINDEVSFKLDYHEVGIPYTTKYQDDRRKFLRNTSNVSSKFWEARLTGLLPGMDYYVVVNVEHPVGTADGNTQYKVFFTTRRQSPIQTKAGKHYLYKVYDKNGKFVNTLNDAGEPNFGLHENGGVSDMTIKLPREASKAGTDDAITLGNRIDVWVIDHTSDGIGRNMVVDSDFDLGGWTTSSDWTVAPTGGVDNGACLKVAGNSTSSYALSEFLQPSTTGDAPKPYRLTISVTNLLDQYEDRLRAANVNYGSLQTEVTTALRNLFPASFLVQGNSADTVLSPQIDRITNQNYGLLRKARDTNNYQILDSIELAVSTESLDELNEIREEVERQGCQVSVNEETEADSVPYVLMLAARALRGQITAQVEYVDVIDPTTGFISTLVSEESVSTYGSNWQVLKLLFTPPRGTRIMRIRLTSQGDTVGSVDKVQLMPQELLIYRGRIEAIKTSISGKGESIDLEVMGLVAQLTDYYVQFKQWVDRQPAKDQPKLVDLSVTEDESPPPTWVADSNLVKFRQADTPENRHAILFPEITATGVRMRVYYDGDDNEDSDCVVYYTPNMNSALTNRVFTGVVEGQVIYSIEEVSMFNEAAGSVLISTFPQNSEFRVISNQLKSPVTSVYKWVEVVSTQNTNLSGWVQFESMTDIRGSRAGGVSAIVLSRSTIPPKTPSQNSNNTGGSGGGGGAGGSGEGGGTGNNSPLTYGLIYLGWSDERLKERRALIYGRRTYLYGQKILLETEKLSLNYRIATLGPGEPAVPSLTSRLYTVNLLLDAYTKELALITKELRNIQTQLDSNENAREARRAGSTKTSTILTNQRKENDRHGKPS